MGTVAIITLANEALNLGIRLAKAARSMPDADSPEAKAKLDELTTRLQNTAAEVEAVEL